MNNLIKTIAFTAFLYISARNVNSQTLEKHLTHIKQLTFGGDNAEAYFSFDNKNLTFQSNNKKWGVECDQIFLMNIEQAAKDSIYKPNKISDGKGRTTCSYFFKEKNKIIYASTHHLMKNCPPMPEPRADHRYLWALYPFDIFIADTIGNTTKQLTNSKGYDAEATISPDGKKIVYTSDKSGDLELYVMDSDGKNETQITFGLGYDGGAFFSPDNKKLVFRASRPQTEEEQKEYKDFLKQGLVAPTNMEIYTCDIDGKNLKQITKLGKANWAPFYHPSGKKIIFSSNHNSNKGYNFNLFMVDENGENLEQITFESNFNAFPMFSFDGKKLVFSSNRNNHGTRDTNLFIADWKE
jgi:Tol biopolymer transport system component